MPRLARPLGLVLAILFAVACNGLDEDGAEPGTAPPPRDERAAPATERENAGLPGAFASIPELVAEAEPSVVAVIVAEGEGSGVIYAEDGLVVTNAHVVQDVQEVELQLATGERVAAGVRAVDVATDLAVLEVDEGDLPAARFADEQPVVGELAIAIGNPIGLENTVTVGVISGVGRTVPSGPITPVPLIDLLQTDAAISPGSSGGALVNARGEVVGVNVAYLPPEAGAVAIGFAIPSTTVVEVVEELLETGEVERGFLGVQVATLTPQIAERFGIDLEAGVLVIAVVEGSPAEEALQPGDVLIAIDGQEVTEAGDVYMVLRASDPQQQVALTVVRDGETQQVEVILDDSPPPVGTPPGVPEAPPAPEFPPD